MILFLLLLILQAYQPYTDTSGYFKKKSTDNVFIIQEKKRRQMLHDKILKCLHDVHINQGTSVHINQGTSHTISILVGW